MRPSAWRGNRVPLPAPGRGRRRHRLRIIERDVETASCAVEAIGEAGIGGFDRPDVGRRNAAAGAFEHRDRFSVDRKSLARRGSGIGRSEEHTSELQSLMRSSYAVFCLQTTTRKKVTQLIT